MKAVLRVDRQFTPVEPKALEYKLYATGIGPVVAIAVSGGSDREELVSFASPTA